jgi:diguanylate cyclase (GGDEF)-like protein/PAS domain S-box-containing protein
MDNLNIIGDYNLLLVTFSVITSIITSYTSILLLSKVTGLTGRKRIIWFFSSAFILGLGIWSMHYIGMLAITLPNSDEFKLLHVLFTLSISILFSFGALFTLIVKRPIRYRIFLGAMLMGVGVSITHYIGMSSMSEHYSVSYSPVFYGSATLFACSFSYLSFRVFGLDIGITMKSRIKSGFLLGIAISGLHYLAMSAATMVYHHNVGNDEDLPVISSTFLGIGLELAIVLIVFILLIIAKVDQKISDQKEIIYLNEQYYKSLYEQNPDTILTFDLEGNFLTANQALTSLFGYSFDALVNKPFTPLIQPEDVDRTLQHFINATKGISSSLDSSIIDAMGNQRKINITNIPITVDRKVTGVYCIVKDITDFIKAQQDLIEAESKYRTLVENSLVGVYIMQAEKIVYINPYLCEMLGYRCEELLNLHLSDYIFSEDLDLVRENLRKRLLDEQANRTYIYRVVRQDQKVLTVQVYGSKIVFEGKDAVIGIVIDVTDREKSEKIIKHMAYHDQLTNLPNRNRFYEKLYELIESSNIHNSEFSLLFIDLDRFKEVNDNMGHEIGDQLLVKIAEKMNSCVQGDGMIFRHGGDEFTVLLPHSSMNKAKTISQKVLDVLSVPILIEQYELIISPSIGIVVFPHHGISPFELIKNADLAMYEAKSKTANHYKVFTKELLLKTQNKIELEMNLRKAVERGEFVLHYQPQVNLETQKMIGVEALIRWNHPEKGLVSPLEFIPYAEESGLIIPIGEWAIREACLQNKTWQQSGYPPITVSVNLSPKQFHSNIVETIQSILVDTDLEANYLELEITESIMMEIEMAISTLKELKNLGVKISIDDFGTGYSSLYYLKKFPIDKLKIDQSFIRDNVHSNDETLVKTIISMGHNLNLKVIAEGVETKKHVDMLTKLNCNEAQGYYFSKPVPATELEKHWQRT